MASSRGPREREQVMDLSRLIEKRVRVQFQGGREVAGVLKGFDPLVNVVLDEAVEYLRDPDDPFTVTEQTREVGLVICRGTQVSLVSPEDGTVEIENPFMPPEEDDAEGAEGEGAEGSGAT